MEHSARLQVEVEINLTQDVHHGTLRKTARRNTVYLYNAMIYNVKKVTWLAFYFVKPSFSLVRFHHPITLINTLCR